MSKIKVLQSVGSLGLGGNEIFVMNFFRNINKDEFQFDFLVYDKTHLDFYEEICVAGSRVFFCNKKFENKYLQSISEIIQVHKILRNNHYDIIHCHSCSLLGILRAVIPAYFNGKINIISHAHNPGIPKGTIFDKISRGIMKYVISKMVDIGCTCSDVAGKSKYTKKLINSNRYRCINNAIVTEKYLANIEKRILIRNELEIDDESFVIGNIGRLEEQKNQSYLIDVFAEIYKLNKNSRLLIVGGGSLFEELSKKVTDEGLDGKVIFAGSKNDATIYYQAMDCFVMTSYYEGFPFVMVEAQVNGLRCVVSDSITRAVNISGGVEFVSLQGSINDWTQAIQKLKNNRLTESGKNEVIEKYEITNEVKNLEQLYKKVINGSRR